ncbi:MAG TPA: hypothetical protein VHE55_04285 [Fimbriimonadaceae bacterium]|nr:hypothetical protein [Fimbriimonadaceae bacterium]
MKSPAFRVLDRLGMAAVDTDENGMRRLYREWCIKVPFDNIRKLIAHLEGGAEPLPGTDADDFLESWLEHGTGGTCWPASNGLYEVARAAGFEGFRATASMWDRGVPTHGTVIVRVDGKDWVIDSSILTMNPFPLQKDSVYVHPGPMHPVEVEWDEGSFVFWFEAANFATQFPWRLLKRHVEHGVYAERYEVSRTTGPFKTSDCSSAGISLTAS